MAPFLPTKGKAQQTVEREEYGASSVVEGGETLVVCAEEGEGSGGQSQIVYTKDLRGRSRSVEVPVHTEALQASEDQPAFPPSAVKEVAVEPQLWETVGKNQEGHTGTPKIVGVFYKVVQFLLSVFVDLDVSVVTDVCRQLCGEETIDCLWDFWLEVKDDFFQCKEAKEEYFPFNPLAGRGEASTCQSGGSEAWQGNLVGVHLVVEDGVSLAGEPPLKNRANYPEVEKLVKCIEEVQQKGSSELVNGLILPEPPLPKLLFPDSSTQAKVCQWVIVTLGYLWDWVYVQIWQGIVALGYCQDWVYVQIWQGIVALVYCRDWVYVQIRQGFVTLGYCLDWVYVQIWQGIAVTLGYCLDWVYVQASTVRHLRIETKSSVDAAAPAVPVRKICTPVDRPVTGDVSQASLQTSDGDDSQDQCPVGSHSTSEEHYTEEESPSKSQPPDAVPVPDPTSGDAIPGCLSCMGGRSSKQTNGSAQPTGGENGSGSTNGEGAGCGSGGGGAPAGGGCGDGDGRDPDRERSLPRSGCAGDEGTAESDPEDQEDKRRKENECENRTPYLQPTGRQDPMFPGDLEESNPASLPSNPSGLQSPGKETVEERSSAQLEETNRRLGNSATTEPAPSVVGETPSEETLSDTKEELVNHPRKATRKLSWPQERSLYPGRKDGYIPEERTQPVQSAPTGPAQPETNGDPSAEMVVSPAPPPREAIGDPRADVVVSPAPPPREAIGDPHAVIVSSAPLQRETNSDPHPEVVILSAPPLHVPESSWDPTSQLAFARPNMYVPTEQGTHQNLETFQGFESPPLLPRPLWQPFLGLAENERFDVPIEEIARRGERREGDSDGTHDLPDMSLGEGPPSPTLGAWLRDFPWLGGSEAARPDERDSDDSDYSD